MFFPLEKIQVIYKTVEAQLDLGEVVISLIEINQNFEFEYLKFEKRKLSIEAKRSI